MAYDLEWLGAGSQNTRRPVALTALAHPVLRSWMLKRLSTV
ncbi:hypothetical protein [Metabacillus niabensis]|nr:hypothetical protein [Metabacillus niabensis]